MKLLPVPNDILTELARRIYRLSVEQWGEESATILIGRHSKLTRALNRIGRIAKCKQPSLIVGDTGTGKEAFARALYLLGRHHRRSLVTVNCGQFQNEHLMASELFGHQKGSFTGATADRKGLFEEAEGGTLFLDEIGELPLAGQAMLLRALGEREILPVGSTRPRRVDVRVIAATNRDLTELVQRGKFREDLYFRLCHVRVHLPPLRERGNDWELIASYHLRSLGAEHHQDKELAPETLHWLRGYSWPGNVRELRASTETGYFLSAGPLIMPEDLAEVLESITREEQFLKAKFDPAVDSLDLLVSGKENFWECVAEPFLARELNRSQVRSVISAGLALAGGSYKQLVEMFDLPPSEYLKFMDFLRHHRLKSSRRNGGSVNGQAPHAGASGTRAETRPATSGTA